MREALELRGRLVPLVAVAETGVATPSFLSVLREGVASPVDSVRMRAEGEDETALTNKE